MSINKCSRSHSVNQTLSHVAGVITNLPMCQPLPSRKVLLSAVYKSINRICTQVNLRPSQRLFHQALMEWSSSITPHLFLVSGAWSEVTGPHFVLFPSLLAEVACSRPVALGDTGPKTFIHQRRPWFREGLASPGRISWGCAGPSCLQ